MASFKRSMVVTRVLNSSKKTIDCRFLDASAGSVFFLPVSGFTLKKEETHDGYRRDIV